MEDQNSISNRGGVLDSNGKRGGIHRVVLRSGEGMNVGLEIPEHLACDRIPEEEGMFRYSQQKG